MKPTPFVTRFVDLVYTKRSNPWKAAVSTALFAFVAVFGMSLLGFLGDLTEWAGDQSGEVEFPSLGLLGKAFVAAVVSSVTGLVNWVVRTVQARTSLIPGAGPSYGPPAE